MFTAAVAEPEPTRAAIDRQPGALVLEFGTMWCGFCRAAQPHVQAALSRAPDVAHIKIEDGSGRRLGRSFAVKLWPTLVFIKDGQEVTRVVRPRDSAVISEALARITS